MKRVFSAFVLIALAILIGGCAALGGDGSGGLKKSPCAPETHREPATNNFNGVS